MTETRCGSLEEELFYKTLRIRRAEEKIIEIYPSDLIQSPVHLSIGQEAVAVGLCRALRQTDWIFGTYRSHAGYLAKGGSLKEFFAELYGKATGCGKGKAGSMHLSSAKDGYLGSSAVVASTISHAVGAAFAARSRKTDQVMVAFFGDGATEEGTYHESLNLAATLKLPVLFLCEDNGLAIHSRISDRQSYDLVEHARTYGMKSFHLEDGMDYMNVYESCKDAVHYCRSESKPFFLKVDTCRYKQHVGIGDDFHMGYREEAEVHVWKKKDPLVSLNEERRNWLQKHSRAIDQEIAEAVEFAASSPNPAKEELYADVY